MDAKIVFVGTWNKQQYRVLYRSQAEQESETRPLTDKHVLLLSLGHLFCMTFGGDGTVLGLCFLCCLNVFSNEFLIQTFPKIEFWIPFNFFCKCLWQNVLS